MMSDRIIEGKINSIQADLATRVQKKKNAWQLPFKANRENNSLVGLSLMKYVVFHFLIVVFFPFSTHSNCWSSCQTFHQRPQPLDSHSYVALTSSNLCALPWLYQSGAN